ncbi:MAG TPA: hypothetical protein VJJ53_03110 [Candidatus Nanoarchaeia archaeon]|nr:hypothetical protein [Candidatus Nanoarchaeia archaeon]
MDNLLEIDGKVYRAKNPYALSEFLRLNARRYDKSWDVVSKSLEIKEVLAPLIPIGVGIGVPALITWIITREQKEILLKSYVEPVFR